MAILNLAAKLFQTTQTKVLKILIGTFSFSLLKSVARCEANHAKLGSNNEAFASYPLGEGNRLHRGRWWKMAHCQTGLV